MNLTKIKEFKPESEAFSKLKDRIYNIPQIVPKMDETIIKKELEVIIIK